MKFSLTQKQQLVLAFIHQYFETHRQSPLIREIQAGCQITSYKSVLDRLVALERKAIIKRLPNKHRGIRLLRQPQAKQPPVASVLAASGETDDALRVEA